MLVKLFIDAGWHTVPLKGELRRLEDGKKTIPQFESNWNKKYSKTFNTHECPLAGALTGKLSNIIAIDCDNEQTFELFKNLDPDYSFIFLSKGKPEGGGTIIYRYDSTVPTFSIKNEFVKLDFFSDGGFVYLPTEENHTKVDWEEYKYLNKLPDLKDIPKTALALLATFSMKATKTVETTQASTQTHSVGNRLGPMLEKFIKDKKYDPVLFRILTPKSFRELPKYVTQGHLHPNDVPEGRGSEYLSKISAILGADISVNVETYISTMQLVNSLWKESMPNDRLMATIINPMIEGRSTVDGKPIWQYDQHWEKMGFIATSLNGDYIEAFYDDVKGQYYLINYTVPYIRSYNEKRTLITTLRTLLGRGLSEAQFDIGKQIIRTHVNPSKEFGHIEGSDQFNLFRQTQHLSVLTNPSAYTTQYKRPETIIKYFETLVPDDFMRQYLLRFIKTKLCTFNYSPVVLYLIGTHGSGKDTLTNILGRIIGQDYVAKPDTKVFLEPYNGWIMDKYFVQLDEYGNKLTRSTDKQEALGKIKSYSGSQEMQVRAMRMDGFNYKHSLTFIVTANSNPLPLESEDRRVAYIKTPNRLDRQDWVIESGGIAEVINRIFSEIMDFCYYLATEVDMLNSDDYVVAPDTKDKEDLILESMPASDLITHYLVKQRYDKLEALGAEFAIPDFTVGWDKGRLMWDKLEALYMTMTEGLGTSQAIIRNLKNAGFNRSHTTYNGNNVFYYFITNLHRYKPSEFTAEDGEFQGVATPNGL